MLQPQYIGIALQGSDLIKQLIILRNKQLKIEFPQFDQSFQKIEKKLMNHSQKLKSMQISATNQLRGRVLDELQRKQYNYHNPKKKEILNNNNTSYRANITPNKTNFGFNKMPYHYTKFQKSLNKFKLQYDQNRSDTHRKVRHIKIGSIGLIQKKQQQKTIKNQLSNLQI